MRCQGRCTGSSLLLYPVCVLEQSSHQADHLESWLDCFVLCEEVTHVLLCLRLALGHKPKDPVERRQLWGCGLERRSITLRGCWKGRTLSLSLTASPQARRLQNLCTVSCVCVCVVCTCLRGHGMCPYMWVEVGVGCLSQLLSTNFETRFLSEPRAHSLASLASQ